MMAAALTLIRAGDTSRELHLYDTFTGMPEPSAEDVDSPYDGYSLERRWRRHASAGREWAGVPAAEVERALRGTGYPAERIHLHPGMVEETLPAQAPERLALLRLDTDWYASTKHELAAALPAARRRRRPDHRRLRPLRGCPAGRRRVPRRDRRAAAPQPDRLHGPDRRQAGAGARDERAPARAGQRHRARPRRGGGDRGLLRARPRRARRLRVRARARRRRLRGPHAGAARRARRPRPASPRRRALAELRLPGRRRRRDRPLPRRRRDHDRLRPPGPARADRRADRRVGGRRRRRLRRPPRPRGRGPDEAADRALVLGRLPPARRPRHPGERRRLPAALAARRRCAAQRCPSGAGSCAG